jgi:hypothetical protein
MTPMTLAEAESRGAEALGVPPSTYTQHENGTARLRNS